MAVGSQCHCPVPPGESLVDLAKTRTLPLPHLWESELGVAWGAQVGVQPGAILLDQTGCSTISCSTLP